MKSLTKVVFVSLMSLFLTSSIFAQASANANATVTASLVKGLSISLTVDALDFGTIQLTGAAQNPAITPDNGSVFKVEGHPNRNVTVTFANATLTNNAWAAGVPGAPTDNMTFTPDVDENQENAVYGVGANNISSGAVVNCPNVTGTGTLYLFVGGAIAIDAAQEAGNYTGTFTMSVAY